MLGFEIDLDGAGAYAEFKHDGIRFSMYERAQLPELLGQPPTYPSGLTGNLWIKHFHSCLTGSTPKTAPPLLPKFPLPIKSSSHFPQELRRLAQWGN